MTFKTSTSVVPLLSVGMYESPLSPDSVFGYEFEDPENAGRNFDEEWNRFDYRAYKSAVGRLAKKHAEDAASTYLNGKYGIKAVTSNGDILSPKFYNFETDVLSIDIEMEENFMETAQAYMRRWAQENGEVAKWVKDHHSSYDGFWSAVPNNLPEIASDIAEGTDIDRLMGVYAKMCLVDAGYFRKDCFSGETEYDNYSRALVADVCSNLYWDEFLVAATA